MLHVENSRSSELKVIQNSNPKGSTMAINNQLERVVTTIAIVIMPLFYSSCLPTSASASNVSLLEITPLWNQNYSGSCLISDDNQTETINLYGSATEKCHVSVILHSELDNNMALRITGSSSEDSFFYIDIRCHDLDCENRYVAIGGKFNEKSCGVIFTQRELKLALHGSANVSISVTSTTESTEICALENEHPLNPRAETAAVCQRWVRLYNETTTCSRFHPIPRICTLDFTPFPSRCNTTLGHREVVHTCFKVDTILTHKVLVLYPDGMIALNSTNKKISALQSNAFTGLQTIQRLHLGNNEIEDLPSDVFNSLSNLELLDLSNNELHDLDVGIFKNLQKLTLLFLNNNNLVQLPNQLFNDLRGLANLFLYRNRITMLHSNQFNSLTRLRVLLLYANKLVSLDSRSFSGLSSLNILVLSYNRIESLKPGVFHDLVNLHTLYLPSNQLTELDYGIFATNLQLSRVDLSSNKFIEIPYIPHLNFLDIQENPLIDVTKVMFSPLSSTSIVVASQHEICECFVPANVSCSAADSRSPYLSCDRLLSDKLLASIMWIIGLTALGGNLFVLMWRIKAKKSSKKNKIQDLLLNNLAISDLLMGLYMLVIASADVYFGTAFPMRSEKWRTGVTCRIAGALSILSSEGSVFFVTIISVDRLICIKYPHTSRALRLKLTRLAVVLTWLIASALGIIPSALAGINFKFYDNSHVCIGLPLALTQLYSSVEITKSICPEGSRSCYTIPLLTTESGPLISGMYFSAAIFLGLNCICYLVVLGCYVEVIRVVYKSSKRAGLNREMREQMRLTFKVAAIVITDFTCWFPVILLGILVQSRVLVLPPSVYAWCVTFVLPINSAINPYMYTIAAVISNRRKRKIGDSSATSQNSSQRRGMEDNQMTSTT